MEYLVYILFSEKLDCFYTGFTSNFEKRMTYHQNAASHKFTAKSDDWELFLKFECSTKFQALSIEKHIKKMRSNVYIKNLKKYPEMRQRLKERYS